MVNVFSEVPSRTKFSFHILKDDYDDEKKNERKKKKKRRRRRKKEKKKNVDIHHR
jgi:hypothetical protein